jgi:hypothetical protein
VSAVTCRAGEHNPAKHDANSTFCHSVISKALDRHLEVSHTRAILLQCEKLVRIAETQALEGQYAEHSEIWVKWEGFFGISKAIHTRFSCFVSSLKAICVKACSPNKILLSPIVSLPVQGSGFGVLSFPWVL